MKKKMVETILEAGNIVEIRNLPDGRKIIVQEVYETTNSKVSTEKSNNCFILVEAEKLSIKDEFMQWEPVTEREKETKEFITEAILGGVKNFYRPKYDPSFSDTVNNICFKSGKEPAVGKSYSWWRDTAKKYDPARNSRLGTLLEYYAFLGVLIKKLVEEGKSVRWAWNAVCNDSEELGHYGKNLKESIYDDLELTGSKGICGFYDLANVFKILSSKIESNGFLIVGGSVFTASSCTPLATFSKCRFSNGERRDAVGWIVLS